MPNPLPVRPDTGSAMDALDRLGPSTACGAGIPDSIRRTSLFDAGVVTGAFPDGGSAGDTGTMGDSCPGSTGDHGATLLSRPEACSTAIDIIVAMTVLVLPLAGATGDEDAHAPMDKV